MRGRFAAVWTALGMVALAAACADDDDRKLSLAPGMDASAGPGPVGLDPMDAGVVGTTQAEADAGGASDGGRADGGCDVVDPRFGCGRQMGSWTRYANGLEIDRASGLAWAPVRPPSGSQGDDAWQSCQGLSIAGLTEFDLPTIDEVRTLAAGCEESRVGGRCPLSDGTCVGAECGTGDACTPCERRKGPHRSGGYCRPELGECVSAWAITACDDDGRPGCPTHRHWYYDVETGGFGLAEIGTVLHGRCVAKIARTP